MWALHFVTPGTHQVTRFTAPRGVPDFDFVRLHKITTDSLEALLDEPGDRIHKVSAEARRTGDPGAWQVAKETQPQSQPETLAVALAGPRLIGEARLVGDSGPEVSATIPMAAVGARTDSLSAEEHHRRGRELIQTGNYQAAIEEFSAAIREQPDWSMVYNARGFAYYLEHDYRRALADLDEAIRLNPQYVNAYQNRRLSRKAAGDARGSPGGFEKDPGSAGRPQRLNEGARLQCFNRVGRKIACLRLGDCVYLGGGGDAKGNRDSVCRAFTGRRNLRGGTAA